MTEAKTAREKIYARAKRVRDLNKEEGSEEEERTIQELMDTQDKEEEEELKALEKEEGVDVSELMNDTETIPDAVESPKDMLDEDEDDPYAEETEEEKEQRLALEDEEKKKESEKTPQEPEKPDIIEVKVEGKTFNVSKQEVDDFGGVEAYQKHRSANMRLRTAATVLAQAQESLTEIEKSLGKPSSGDPTPTGASKKAEAKSVVKALFDGEDEEAIEALSELVSNREVVVADEQLDKLHAGVDAARTAATLYQDDITRQISETNEVVSELFKDINDNTDLKSLMFTRFKTLQDDPDNEGRELKYLAIDAGNWVRELLNRPNVSDDTTASDEPAQLEKQRKAKVKAKRKLPHQGSASSPREEKPAPRRKTKSDAIAAMKAARGQ